MTREEVVNEANNWNNDNIPLVTRENERLCRRAFMAGYNAAMNEADAHPHWISVDDELPKKYGAYLVFNSVLDTQDIYVYSNGEWWYNVFHCPSGIVTHWMPLPQPPKKGE